MAKKKGYNREPFLTDDHRAKIANSNILNVLIEHAEGRKDMGGTQVTAAIALLKKVMPDLSSKEHTGNISHEHYAGIDIRIVRPDEKETTD